MTLKKGGWFSRLTNRSELRNLSQKIYQRSATFDEVKIYLEKGGSPDTLTNYGEPVPFMKDPELPLLNYFLTGEGFEDHRQDRLKSLTLLLENGANPNRKFKPPMMRKQDVAPILFASWLGDLDGSQLLLKHGTDVNAIQNLSSYAFGPALLVARKSEMALLILTKNPDLRIRSSDGYNMIQQLVFSPEYSNSPDVILTKLQWMQDNKIRFSWNEKDSLDPIQRANWMKNQYEASGAQPDPKRSKLWSEISALLPKLKE